MKKAFRSTLNGALATLFEVSPFLATRLGESGFDHLSDDYSPRGRARWRAGLKAALEQLESIERISLGAAEQLEIEALASLLEVLRRRDKDLLIHERDPDLYVRELAWALFGLLEGPGPLAERAHCLLERLRNVGRHLEVAIANLKRGYDIPAEWTRTAVLRLEGLDRLFREQLHPFARTAGRRAEQLGDAVEGARRQLVQFRRQLAEELLPRCDGQFAVGRSFFQLLLKRQHGSEARALEIGQRAEEELHRLEQRLHERAGALGLAADVAGTVAYLQRRSPAAGRLLAAYRKELQSASGQLAALGLPAPPRDAAFGPRPAPPFCSPDHPQAFFEALALLGRPQGAVLVMPVDSSLPEGLQAELLAEHSNYQVQIRCWREGVPGKALQFAHAVRGTSRIRRLLRSPSTIEGWGLYVLDLLEEAGALGNPRLAFMVELERLRAALEAVLDVRLHLQALPFVDAVEQLMRRGQLPPAVAEVTARRLAHQPTYGVAAFAGRQEILRLRADLAEARGPRFKPAELHERLLRMGGAPLGAVREAALR
ncbi:MAG: hypothetical protein KatS3mg102_0516 [Planctomycetota bacterium]|nr:MAG: hypothetical protein KatS3mg102_0516 [Planctomycetota bacterium]